MLDLVARNLDRIQAACRRHGVSFLDLVGSEAREDFDRARSDIDVLVDFPDGATDLFGSFMGLSTTTLDHFVARRSDLAVLQGAANRMGAGGPLRAVKP
jgi:predicted nucleotidyltransferase